MLSKGFLFLLFWVFCFSFPSLVFSSEFLITEDSDIYHQSQELSETKKAKKQLNKATRLLSKILDSPTPPSYKVFYIFLKEMNIQSIKDYLELLSLEELELQNLPKSPQKYYGKKWKGWPKNNYNKNGTHNQLDKERFIESEINQIEALERGEGFIYHKGFVYYNEHNNVLDKHHNNTRRIKKMPYAEAQAVVQNAGIKTEKEFKEWKKAGHRPPDFPGHPYSYYRKSKDWVSWPHLFGREGRNRKPIKDMMPYAEAQAVMQKDGVTTVEEFREWVRAGNRPSNFPGNPYFYYKGKGEWVSWPHLFGTEKCKKAFK